MLYMYGADSTGIAVPSNVISQFFLNKKAEYTAFATAKSTYETARDAYNTKLTAAEKLQKDTIDKDMFRKMTPTAEDLKVLNAVPTRPDNPSVPAAYAGPKDKGSLTTGNWKNTMSKRTSNVADVGAWNKFQFTDYPIASNLELVPGKSWGTNGYGLSDNTVATSASDGTSTALGFTYMKMTTATPPVCNPHYMMLQSGVIPAASACTSCVQKWKYGVKDFASTFDALTAPTAATAP